jgi:hypothetical protein
MVEFQMFRMVEAKIMRNETSFHALMALSAEIKATVSNAEGTAWTRPE